MARVTVHMVASLDGFIARNDGRVDFLETADQFSAGQVLDAAAMEAVLGGIDCYVMGARTFETALRFAQAGRTETSRSSWPRVVTCPKPTTPSSSGLATSVGC